MRFKKRTAVGYFWHQQGWIYALLILAGIALATFKITEAQAAARVLADGVEAVGQVTDKSYSSRAGKGLTTYRLGYSFPTPDDPYTRGEQVVSQTFYDAQSEGAEILVRYLPSDVGISAVEPDSLATLYWLALAASAGLVLAGLAGGAYTILRALACVGLRETGEIRAAEVTGHVTEGKKNTTGHMQWRDAVGMTGRTDTRRLGDLLPVGTAITIFADPEGRRKAVWEGDIGSR
ncbi:DUF3592 domain-containing protein [Phaeovulum sp.]|uniref:DUF3592 domain-containing protein n=1 Tax=Phaeovulum sp. TaxID=2934796 RepID=UPI003569E551